MPWNLMSGLAFGAAVLCLVSMLLNQSLFGATPLAIGVQIAGALLMIWARLTFGLRSFHATAAATEGGLVTRGPYRWMRHPIYASILYFVWAAVLSHLSAPNFFLGLLATAMLSIRMLAEERMLTETYPEYEQYARKTARVIPFVL